MKAKVVEARCFRFGRITVCLWRDYSGRWVSLLGGWGFTWQPSGARHLSRWTDVAVMLAAEAKVAALTDFETAAAMRTLAEDLIGWEVPISKWPPAADRWDILPYWCVVAENGTTAYLCHDGPFYFAGIFGPDKRGRVTSAVPADALGLLRRRFVNAPWEADLLQVLAWASVDQVDPGYEAELPPLLTPPPPVPPAARFDPEAMASELEAMAKRLRQFAKR